MPTPTETPAELFKRLKAELDAKHAARRAGVNVTDAEMLALAQQVTDAYNVEAKRIARQFGRRPVLANVKRFLLG